MIAYDNQGRVTQANHAAVEMLGLASEQDIVGSLAVDAGWHRTDSAGWPDLDNLHPAVAAIQTGQPQLRIVNRCNRPDGSEVWIQVDAIPVMGGRAVVGVLATLTDISKIVMDSRLPRPRYGDDALAEVTAQLAAARLDPAAILLAVTGTLSRLRSGTWVASLINKDPRTSRVVAANDADPLVARYIEDMHLSPTSPTFTMATQVIETGEPVLIPTVPYDEFVAMLRDDVREYLSKNQPPVNSPVRYLGVLVVPMRARGATVGTLGLFERRSSNPLTEDDVRWLQVIADRAGLAATGSPDLRLTLRVILDQVAAGLGVDAADILMLDEKDATLELVASTGFQSTSIPDYRLPVDEGLPGRAMLGQRIETVTALGAFTQFRRRSLFAREGFRSYGAVPLIARGKLTGVLEVFHRSQLQPDQEWQEFFETLGSEAAIAIDNAGMHDRLQRTGSPTAAKAPAPDLTKLENEILTLLVEGDSNREIAVKVHLSPNTIKSHVRQLLQKLDVGNRTELARKATREGWL